MAARPGRRTNLAVLALLTGAFATGWWGFALASGPAAWSVRVAHGLCGLGLLALVPWKSAIVRRAARRRVAGVALVVVLAACLAAGFVEVFGGYGFRAGLTPIQVHVGAALVALPLVVVHLVRHGLTRPRRTDLARRRVLRLGVGATGVAASYLALEGLGWAAASPAATRIVTGSHRVLPADVPATIWLADRVPALPPDAPVTIAGQRWTPAELDARARPVRARLDCTSGWFCDAEWSAVALSDLLGPAVPGSVTVVSATGYRRLFAAHDAARLFLATRFEGRLLTAERGAPVRLLAPGQRGFWWAKWVVAVEPSTRPEWLQPPFPLQ